MKTMYKSLTMAAVIALLGAPTAAKAEHGGFLGLGNYMPHFDYVLPDDIAGKYYMEYEQREPCQHYRVVPNSVMGMASCVEPKKDGKIRLLPVVATYTVYFDFDKSNIRKNQWGVLDQVVREMNVYHPAQVTVVGHTDTSGSMDYNRKLSARRADSVSKELTARNIANFYLDEQAMGEENLAVPTPDGTRLEENRRVVIQFRK